MRPKLPYGAVVTLARRFLNGDFGDARPKEVASANGTNSDTLRGAVMRLRRKIKPVVIVCRRQRGENVRAIVKAAGWFATGSFSPLYGEFYVVATWVQYEGYPKREDWEAQTTIAMCASLADAQTIYRRRK